MIKAELIKFLMVNCKEDILYFKSNFHFVVTVGGPDEK